MRHARTESMGVARLSIALIACLAATAAGAGNAAFRLSYELRKPPASSGQNWVSIPYRTIPDGEPSKPPTLMDLCASINQQTGNPLDPKFKVILIFSFDTMNDRPSFCNCEQTLACRQIVPGEGYSLVPWKDRNTVQLVGSHDDAYAKNKAVPTRKQVTLRKPPGKSGQNWFGVPYHAVATTLVELCNDLNDGPRPTKVAQVFYFDAVNDRAGFQSCGARFGRKPLVVGEGYSLVPVADGVQVSVTVY